MKQLLLILVLAIAAGAQTSAPQTSASDEGKSAKIVEMQNAW